jgi:hypothetical protein
MMSEVSRTLCRNQQMMLTVNQEEQPETGQEPGSLGWRMKEEKGEMEVWIVKVDELRVRWKFLQTLPQSSSEGQGGLGPTGMTEPLSHPAESHRVVSNLGGSRRHSTEIIEVTGLEAFHFQYQYGRTWRLRRSMITTLETSRRLIDKSEFLYFFPDTSIKHHLQLSLTSLTVPRCQITDHVHQRQSINL